MTKNPTKMKYLTTEFKNGSGEGLSHNIRFDFINGWELSLSLGAGSYSRKIQGTDIFLEVEAAVFQDGKMLYITHTKETVIPYLRVVFIPWLCDILGDADFHGEYDTLKDINELIVHSRSDLDGKKD